jgi:hypothetical protein
MGSDLTDQQCVLNFRHTDCTDYGHWTEKIYVRGQQRSLQWNFIKQLISRCKEMWAGSGWRACGGGGRGWGLAASFGLLREIYMFYVLERA